MPFIEKNTKLVHWDARVGLCYKMGYERVVSILFEL